MQIKWDHLDILVEDWDKTVDFYHQLFGFVEGRHIPGGHKNCLYTADHSQALIHLTTLESKASNLAHPDNPLQIQATPVSQNKNTGAVNDIAWVVESADFDLLLNKLDALKVEYRISRKQLRKMWFFDPNGVKFEIADKS